MQDGPGDAFVSQLVGMQAVALGIKDVDVVRGQIGEQAAEGIEVDDGNRPCTPGLDYGLCHLADVVALQVAVRLVGLYVVLAKLGIAAMEGCEENYLRPQMVLSVSAGVRCRV